MADTRTVAGESTLGLAEETRDYLNRVSNAWVENTQQSADAAQRVADTFSAFVPALSRDYAVPSPKQVIDTTFDIANQVVDYQRQALDFQRRIAQQIVDGFGRLYSSDEQPASEKAAQRANEALQKVGQQTEENVAQARQSNGKAGTRA